MLQKAYASLQEHNIHFTITRASVEDVREVIRNESTFLLETELGITATATVRLPWTPPKKPEAPWPFLHWFAVNERAKGKGYGAKIISYAEETFLRDQLKAPAVFLATAIRHPWLTTLYQRRGYEAFHTAINPLGVELVYLRKILNQEIYEAQEQKEYVRTIADTRVLV
jgi:GNAT superfamily N-acetyltransferase